jgi:hypothetical protein
MPIGLAFKFICSNHEYYLYELEVTAAVDAKPLLILPSIPPPKAKKPGVSPGLS